MPAECPAAGPADPRGTHRYVFRTSETWRSPQFTRPSWLVRLYPRDETTRRPHKRRRRRQTWWERARAVGLWTGRPGAKWRGDRQRSMMKMLISIMAAAPQDVVASSA